MKKYSECSLCGKTNGVGCNKPNSLHRTKRKIKPNLQFKNKKPVCTSCLKKI